MIEVKINGLTSYCPEKKRSFILSANKTESYLIHGFTHYIVEVEFICPVCSKSHKAKIYEG
jgi:hypothetical protein